MLKVACACFPVSCPLIGPAPALGPDAGEALNPFGRDAKRSGHPDQNLFEIADVLVHVAPVRAEIEDGIADELTGTVVGDVSATTGLEDLHARFLQVGRTGEHVGPIVAGLHTEGDDRGMLKEQELIRNASRSPLLDEAFLEIQRLGIRHDAKPAHV